MPRKDGKPSFNAGPKIVYIDRVVWNFIPDPATASAALTQGEIDWWENPTIDLVPQLKSAQGHHAGGEGPHRRDRLPALQPSASAVRQRRRSAASWSAAIDQKEIMEAVAGAEPTLIKTDVGLFVPGTPMASTVGVEVTRGPKDYDKLKQDLVAAGYKGEKVVILAASTIPTIWAEAQVGTDMLQSIGMNIDLQALEWGSVVQRRASKEPIDKGGWNIFYTYLGGFGNISPAPTSPIRSSGTNGSWFGWPTDPKMEELRARLVRRAGCRGAEEDLRARCRWNSGRTRPTRRSACTTSRPRSAAICRTFATAGRSSTE